MWLVDWTNNAMQQVLKKNTENVILIKSSALQ